MSGPDLDHAGPGTTADDAPPWSTRPRAVVFDCDGLLVDTEPCWTVAETELFARRGLPFGPEQKTLLIGRSLPAACAQAATLFGDPGRGPDLERELLELVGRVVEARAEPMPGAHALGVAPGHCVAFEDSATGVGSARAAGVSCVGVPSLPGVDLAADVVASLTDPRLPAWIATW